MKARQSRAIGVLILVALVAGCTFKSVYNRLDDLIPQYVEGIITLDATHEELLEQRSELLLQWHRSTQLKQYASWLQGLQQDIGPGLTEARLEQHVQQMEELWLNLLVRLNDEMAGLLPLLNQAQLDELFIYLEDTNAEFRDEYVDIDDEERVAAYAEYTRDTYENWIGGLTDVQAAMVEQAATELVNTSDLRYRQRLEWQQGIRQILETTESEKARREQLRAFLAGFEQDDDSELDENTRINRNIILRLTVRVSQAMTGEQKDFFVEKTGKYIRIFTELAENR